MKLIKEWLDYINDEDFIYNLSIKKIEPPKEPFLFDDVFWDSEEEEIIEDISPEDLLDDFDFFS